MTLERDGFRGPYVLECTDCHDILETDCKDFEEARDHYRERGWVARQWEGEWIHLCPDCIKSEKYIPGGLT